MPRAAFVVPGPLDAATGGSRYDRMMVRGLRQRGWHVDVHELEGDFPSPSPADVRTAVETIASIPDRTLAVVDGLVLSALPDAIDASKARLRIVAIVHLPIAADVSLDPDLALQLGRGERRALAAAHAIVVTGKSTPALLERYEILRDRIAVIEPGTEARPVARGSKNQVVRLLCVATLQPGKGHHILFEALREVLDCDWRLTCAGSISRSPATAERLRKLSESWGLADRVSFAGELDEAALSARYDESDVFVLATLQETYGMAVAEAIAHGLPVVSTRCGAIPSLVEPGGGLLVAPGDVPAFSAALGRMIREPGVRAALAEGARRRRGHLASPDDAVARLESLLQEIDLDV